VTKPPFKPSELLNFPPALSTLRSLPHLHQRSPRRFLVVIFWRVSIIIGLRPQVLIPLFAPLLPSLLLLSRRLSPVGPQFLPQFPRLRLAFSVGLTTFLRASYLSPLRLHSSHPGFRSPRGVINWRQSPPRPPVPSPLQKYPVLLPQVYLPLRK